MGIIAKPQQIINETFDNMYAGAGAQRGWAKSAFRASSGAASWTKAKWGKGLHLTDNQGIQKAIQVSANYYVAAFSVYLNSANSAGSELRVSFSQNDSVMSVACTAADLVFAITKVAVTVGSTSYAFPSTLSNTWVRIICGVACKNPSANAWADVWVNGTKVISDEVVTCYLPLYFRLSAHASSSRDEIVFDSGGFEAYDIGNLTGQNGWTGSPSGTVVSTPVHAGTRSIKIAQWQLAYKMFSFCKSTNNAIFEFELYIDWTDGYHAFSLLLPSTTLLHGVTIYPTYIQWKPGSTTAISPTTWYTVKIVGTYGPTQNTYAFYLDGDLKYTGLTGTGGSFGGIKLESLVLTPVGAATFFDDLKITEVAL